MTAQTISASHNPTRPNTRSWFRRIFSWRNLAIGFAVFVLAIALYFTIGWNWMATWGATPQEISAPLPGDELVPVLDRQTTQAVTIRAAPAQIYPWLLQIGVDRGGMYSYDDLENLFGLNVHTLNRIDPELQQVKVGDFWRFTPKDSAMADGPGVYVMQLDPRRGVVGCFGVASAPPPPCTGTWQLIMQPGANGTTRLILRSRTAPESPMSGALGKVFDVVTFVMQRGMLLGFRDRIEAAAAPTP